MKPATIAKQLFKDLADLSASAGFAATIAATTPAGWAIGITACAVGLLAHSWGEASDKEATEEQAADTLRSLTLQHDSLLKAIAAIAAEQTATTIFSAERANDLLGILNPANARDKEQENRQEELLTYIGSWLSNWCEKHDTTTDDFLKQLTRVEQQTTATFDAVKSLAVEHREASSNVLDQLGNIHSRLGELTQLQRPTASIYDGTAAIEEAVSHLLRRSFDIAEFLLKRIRDTHWAELSRFQRFRVIANLGHIKERRDLDHRAAAALFVQAADLDPDNEKALPLRAVAALNTGDRGSAFQLASAAIQSTHAYNGIVHSVRIRSAPESVGYAELESAVPADLRTDPEVAFALGLRLLQTAHFQDRGPTPDEVQRCEALCRIALDSHSTTPIVRAELGMVIIESERLASFDLGFVSTSGVARLREGISYLTTALDEFGNYIEAATRGRILFARGVARHLLGDREDARIDFERAYGDNPEDPDLIVQKSLLLHEGRSTDSAIALLRTRLDERPRWSLLLLCRMLVQRNNPGDRDEAEHLLSAALHQYPVLAPDLLYEMAGDLIDTLYKNARIDEARHLLERLPADALGLVLYFTLRAGVEHLAGDDASGREYIRTAATHLDESTPTQFRLAVAATAQALAEYGLAFSVLNPLTPRDRLTGETRPLLFCAQALGNDNFILGFCEELRNAGILEWQFIALEAQLRARYSDYEPAIRLLEDFLARNPTERLRRLARVQLSTLGIQSSRLDLVERDPSRLPDVSDVDADWGAITARIIRYTDPTSALTYAYRLVRRNFNHEEAHLALIQSTLTNENQRIVLPAFPHVGPGAAVRYREEGSDRDLWLVIETDSEPSPDLGHREVPADHILAQALNGLGADERFIIDKNGIADRYGVIQEIVDRRVYRVRDSAEHFRERFPTSESCVLVVSVVNGRGEPDFTPILRSIDQFTEQRNAIIRQWHNDGLPIAWIAQATNRSLLDSVAYLVSQSYRIVFCEGGVPEHESALSSFRDADTLVLDPVALSVLYLSNVYPLIRRGPLRLVTCRAVIEEFRHLIVESRSALGYLGRSGGRYVLVEEDNDRVEHQRQSLREFVNWIENNVEAESSLVLADIPLNERNNLIANIGVPSASTMLSARANGRLLWTDDLHLAMNARRNGACSTIWSQVAIRHLVETGQAEAEAEVRLVTWLCRTNFFFKRASPQNIIKIAEVSGWDTSCPNLASVLRLFAVAETEAESLFIFAGATLAEVWRQAPNIAAAYTVTESIVANLLSIPIIGLTIIARIQHQALGIAWPDTSKSLHLRTAVRRALGRHLVEVFHKEGAQ